MRPYASELRSGWQFGSRYGKHSPKRAGGIRVHRESRIRGPAPRSNRGRPGTGAPGHVVDLLDEVERNLTELCVSPTGPDEPRLLLGTSADAARLRYTSGQAPSAAPTSSTYRTSPCAGRCSAWSSRTAAAAPSSPHRNGTRTAAPPSETCGRRTTPSSSTRTCAPPSPSTSRCCPRSTVRPLPPGGPPRKPIPRRRLGVRRRTGGAAAAAGRPRPGRCRRGRAGCGRVRRADAVRPGAAGPGDGRPPDRHGPGAGSGGPLRTQPQGPASRRPRPAVDRRTASGRPVRAVDAGPRPGPASRTRPLRCRRGRPPCGACPRPGWWRRGRSVPRVPRVPGPRRGSPRSVRGCCG